MFDQLPETLVSPPPSPPADDEGGNGSEDEGSDAEREAAAAAAAAAQQQAKPKRRPAAPDAAAPAGDVDVRVPAPGAGAFFPAVLLNFSNRKPADFLTCCLLTFRLAALHVVVDVQGGPAAKKQKKKSNQSNKSNTGP